MQPDHSKDRAFVFSATCHPCTNHVSNFGHDRASFAARRRARRISVGARCARLRRRPPALYIPCGTPLSAFQLVENFDKVSFDDDLLR
ncbi:hypothetical protein AXF42_Ash014127 [Apostasia shenzhenica]|uniref:Uncharacterized protein n=1 Tax=Apostasia shenzhenica TaxID=1088818 RepID=A0A2I0A9H4_9ASPA|nr:hypothetical protein AXF42_Ash014127 [Apostasia shenzhenica]